MQQKVIQEHKLERILRGVIFKTKIEMERQVPDVFNVFALGEKFTICAENFFLLTIPFSPSDNWLILNALDASCDS